MKFRLFAAIMLAAGALNASAQRVSLEVPLSPTPTTVGNYAPLTAPAFMPAAPTALTAGLLSSPHLSPLIAQPVALGAVPIPLANPVALPALPRSLVPKQLAPSKHDKNEAPKVIDSLREHGAKTAELSNLRGESGKGALETNFLSAASLGDGGIVPPAGGDALTPAPDDRPLLTRMLERVKLDDRGKADEKKALEAAFKRLLETPTGRRYAEEFLAEGLKGSIQFEDFPDSQLILVDNRKKFFAAQAFTDFKEDGTVLVRLNRHYVDGDADYLRESLPSVMGHELLGHGLWYGRADKVGLKVAFHYHELNETMARLVGWAIDHELDGKFEDAGAWNFANDPAHYLTNLKMRQAYYSTTFSAQEMSDPVATLRSRVAPAKAEIERSKRNLASQKTWPPVVDHFVKEHKIDPKRFELLRKELADQEAYHAAEIANSEAVLNEVTVLLGKIEAETDNGSQNYLRGASASPLFARLREDAERMMTLVRSLASSGPYEPPRPPAPRPKGQISWEEFIQMYRDDLAADAQRSHKHWQ